jgi:hypothetical protein
MLITRLGSALVRLATLGWLVMHFTLTLLFVLPVNPIKIRLSPLLDVTIGSFFYQNWSLFAPNPAASDEALIAHCFDRPVDVVSQAPLPEDGWYDMSLPLWRRHQHHRFAAYDRLARPHTNALRQYLSGSASLRPYLDSCRKGSTASCDLYARMTAADRRYAISILRMVASSFCLEAKSGARSQSFALRARETTGFPWSERYSPDERPHQDVDIGLFPVEPVAALGLYRVDE